MASAFSELHRKAAMKRKLPPARQARAARATAETALEPAAGDGRPRDVRVGVVRARLAAAETAPRGDGHPVLVLPGLCAGDNTTVPLRRFLDAPRLRRASLGTGPELRSARPRHQGHGRPGARACEDEHGRKVSLVGWSLGGAMANALALRMPRAHPPGDHAGLAARPDSRKAPTWRSCSNWSAASAPTTSA